MVEKRKRGRPKNPNKKIRQPGGKRGRPFKDPEKALESKRIKKEIKEKITVVGESVEAGELDEEEVILKEEELYIAPKIERKIRVIRLDYKVFHGLNDMVKGDIVRLSYIVNRLMQIYSEKPTKFKIQKGENYYTWCSKNADIEPMVITEFARESTMVSGIPLQYRYPVMIDDVTASTFENVATRSMYHMYILNELVKLYVEGKIKVSMGGLGEWWVK
jgi:hypothetical protein